METGHACCAEGEKAGRVRRTRRGLVYTRPANPDTGLIKCIDQLKISAYLCVCTNSIPFAWRF